jgi:hypothetical protein
VQGLKHQIKRQMKQNRKKDKRRKTKKKTRNPPKQKKEAVYEHGVYRTFSQSWTVSL